MASCASQTLPLAHPSPELQTLPAAGASEVLPELGYGRDGPENAPAVGRDQRLGDAVLMLLPSVGRLAEIMIFMINLKI